MKLHQTKIGVQKEMPREDADDDAHRAAQKYRLVCLSILTLNQRGVELIKPVKKSEIIAKMQW